MKLKYLKINIAVFFLLTLLVMNPASAELKTGDDVSPPLGDLIETTLDWTAKTSDVDVDDYTMVTDDSGSALYMPVDDAYIYAGTSGESALDTGTSYVNLEESTILGDYASESGTWSDYAFLETSYGSVTETQTNQTQTNPALSAGSSDVYLSAVSTHSSSDGIDGGEQAAWTADIWNDIDGDGTDDSATVTEEEYVPLTKDVYIYFIGKVVSSDTDASTWMYVQIDFYTGSTDYSVTIKINGGSDPANANTHSWVYTGANVAYLNIYEAEAEYVAVLIDLADLIADDTDSSPNIAGINDITLTLMANAGFGDGTADTVTGYIRNLAIFDQLPALTDRDLGIGNTVDWNGDATNTVTGDATNYEKHDILLPYVAAASNNDWDTRVYFEEDISDGEELLSRWHMLSIDGKMRIPPNRDFTLADFDIINGILMETEIGSEDQRRDVSLYWDFDYKRPSDLSDFVTSGFAPVLTAHVLIQILDTDDNYADSVLEMEESLIEGSVLLGTADKYDDLHSSWDSWGASSTELSLDLWTTDPADGDNVELHYSYYTHESGASLEDLAGDLDNAMSYAKDNYPAIIAWFIAFLIFLGIIKPKED